MSDVDPGAQLSTTDLTEQDVEDAVEAGAPVGESRAGAPHPVIVDPAVGASATGVGTDDLDDAVGEPTGD